RQAVPAKVERDHAGRVGQIAAYLVQPAQIALRPAVDEQQGGSLGVSPLSRVELEPAAAEDLAGGNRNRERPPVQGKIAVHLVSPCVGVPDDWDARDYATVMASASARIFVLPVAVCTQPGRASGRRTAAVGPAGRTTRRPRRGRPCRRLAASRRYWSGAARQSGRSGTCGRRSTGSSGPPTPAGAPRAHAR